MTNTEATRLAMLELGPEAATEDLIRHAAEKLGVRLDARFVPIYRAAVHGEVKRQEMWVIAAQVAKEDSLAAPNKRRRAVAKPTTITQSSSEPVTPL